ncbi:MAG: hypothetical protein HYS22_01145 [Deltaproteobacteria bacterium]|nr:hypothetical protein [Deltaproteobacteria bacterium]
MALTLSLPTLFPAGVPPNHEAEVPEFRLRLAAAEGCTKDTDCKGTRVCEEGSCVETNSVPGLHDEATSGRQSLTFSLQLIKAEQELAGLERAKTTGTILYVASGVFLIPAAALLIYWIGDDVTPISIPIVGASFSVASAGSFISGALVYPSQSELDAAKAKIQLLRGQETGSIHDNPNSTLGLYQDVDTGNLSLGFAPTANLNGAVLTVGMKL